jgi:hypothetical protein
MALLRSPLQAKLEFKMVEVRATVDAKVKRGQASWNYIYLTLAFALTFEGTIIQMIPFPFPFNVVVYALAFVGTCCLFLLSGGFQNRLIGWKASYEDKAR